MYRSWERFFRALPDERRDISHRDGEIAEVWLSWEGSSCWARIDLIFTDITDNIRITGSRFEYLYRFKRRKKKGSKNCRRVLEYTYLMILINFLWGSSLIIKLSRAASFPSTLLQAGCKRNPTFLRQDSFRHQSIWLFWGILFLPLCCFYGNRWGQIHTKTLNIFH